jgi:hypothetical protein
MIIKKFKHFESVDFNDFPSLDEVKEYFYDFTDELYTSIDDYDFGYIFFNTGDTIISIDILNTKKTNSLLEYSANFIRLNREYEKEILKKRIELIESGKEPSYEYIFIHFDKHLFHIDKLPILIDCLKTLYSHTGFRPIHSLWTEDYVIDDTEEVETLYGFEGTFVRVSDIEYEKLCNIFRQGHETPTLTKLFI